MLTSFFRKLAQTKKVELYTGFLIVLIILSSMTMVLINKFYFKYHGISYVPVSLGLSLLIILFAIYAGFFIMFGKQHFSTINTSNFIYVFSIVLLLAFYTSAIQLTPRPIIDHLLLEIDLSLGFNTLTLLNTTYNYPIFVSILRFCYQFLNIELTCVLLSLCFIKTHRNRQQFLFLLLLTALIGFSIYYLFPTIAPPGIIDSHHFTQNQKATAIKFIEIHSYQNVTTTGGGLIAMPSFHTIWALICQYYLYQCSKKIAWLIFPINVGIVLACLCLGWHYLVDILTSIIIVIVSIKSSKCVLPNNKV